MIRAPRSRVWGALTTSTDFAQWFGAEVEGEFEAGKRMDMVSTHPCSGSSKPGFYLIVERMEPEYMFSWRWHPGSAKADEDGSTLVEFYLEEVADGTRVTVTESGFENISLARRAKAFSENGNGWEMQLESLKKHADEAA